LPPAGHPCGTRVPPGIPPTRPGQAAFHACDL